MLQGGRREKMGRGERLREFNNSRGQDGKDRRGGRIRNDDGGRGGGRGNEGGRRMWRKERGGCSIIVYNIVVRHDDEGERRRGAEERRKNGSAQCERREGRKGRIDRWMNRWHFLFYSIPTYPSSHYCSLYLMMR